MRLRLLIQDGVAITEVIAVVALRPVRDESEFNELMRRKRC